MEVAAKGSHKDKVSRGWPNLVTTCAEVTQTFGEEAEVVLGRGQMSAPSTGAQMQQGAQKHHLQPQLWLSSDWPQWGSAELLPEELPGPQNGDPRMVR